MVRGHLLASLDVLLEGSQVVESELISSLIKVTMLLTLLITLLVTSHEPSSKLYYPDYLQHSSWIPFNTGHFRTP